MNDFASDIPMSLAQAAHNGTSFVPERRGEQEREGYAETLKGDYAALVGLCDTDEKRAKLEEEFARYREGYRRKAVAHLVAKGRVISPMITGPARFPVERNRKRCDTEHRRLTELLEFRERALKAIRKELCPEDRPIMSGDADAVGRLSEKIGAAERRQEFMKAVNDAHKKFLKDPTSLDAAEFSDETKAKIRNYKPAYSWEPHPFAPFELTNNGANIRTMKKRMEGLVKVKGVEDVVSDGEAARVEDCAADNRVRLFFPGKPGADVRAKLKASGFRWTPSLGCWRAYRNGRTIAVANEVAGVKAEAI